MTIEALDKQINRLESWIKSLKAKRNKLIAQEWQEENVKIGSYIMVRSSPQKVIGIGFRGRLPHAILESGQPYYGKIIEASI